MPRERNDLLRRLILPPAAAVLLAVTAWLLFLRPCRILVANATLAQQADLALTTIAEKSVSASQMQTCWRRTADPCAIPTRC